ncbi:MAG TPA: hypothetical protein VFV83_06895 [Chthoniobacteraceae bacterium]|nr:hypothetical protein [Chthoniobacteraceae bacterium]
MDEDIIKRAETYAASRGRALAGRLGFGIHGMVFVLEGNADSGVSAVKIHENEAPYRREREIYERLAVKNCSKVIMPVGSGFGAQLFKRGTSAGILICSARE